MAKYKIYAGERYKSLDFICVKEFSSPEEATQYAFDCALDKLFPYSSIDAKNTNTYSNALDKIDYYIEEI